MQDKLIFEAFSSLKRNIKLLQSYRLLPYGLTNVLAWRFMDFKSFILVELYRSWFVFYENSDILDPDRQTDDASIAANWLTVFATDMATECLPLVAVSGPTPPQFPSRATQLNRPTNCFAYDQNNKPLSFLQKNKIILFPSETIRLNSIFRV